jgi:hypothetical protein
MSTLRNLAEEFSRIGPDDPEPPRLWVGESEAGLFVDFYGDPAEEPFRRLCDAIADVDVGARLTCLLLRGPDRGANGTSNWDLEPLAAPHSHYPCLKTLSIEQGRAGSHNFHVVGESYDENGVLGRLLRKMPALEALTTPSAPDREFFRGDARSLRWLSVNAGYAHQDFLRNLAEATNLPVLQTLEYGEPTGVGFEDFTRATVRSYAALVSSTSVQLNRLVLRNPSLSEAELRRLKALRPAMQLLVVRCQDAYI